MKTAKNLLAHILIMTIVLNCFLMTLFAQTPTKTSAQKAGEIKDTSLPSERMSSEDYIKVADFYLRNGDLVFGKLVLEDKNRVTVEQIEGSKIVVSTYSKREVDTRTIRIKNVPEHKHYVELAEYFSGRTWDFEDDPDDFIQAIRCYEKAKQSIGKKQKQAEELIESIDEKIELLHKDREVWTKEVESRAKLKKMEFDTTIETKLEELEEKVVANTQQLKDMEGVDELVTNFEEDFKTLQDDIVEMDDYYARELDFLDEKIEDNRLLIDRIDYRYSDRPRNYRPYQRRDRMEEEPLDEFEE